jgi:hypothetical protein
MHEGILRRLRELVRRGDYSLTDHAEEELDAEELSALDVERIVLSGFVADRQRDTPLRRMEVRDRGTHDPRSMGHRGCQDLRVR